LLLDDRAYRFPSQGAATNQQRGANNELNQQDDQIVLLTTHFAAGIRGATTGASFSRGINLMAAGAASYERHIISPCDWIIIGRSRMAGA